ncbi:MAG TPA: NfeD family protein [Devosia sp.]|nr:NfeD family protein [Devosia sp.]
MDLINLFAQYGPWSWVVGGLVLLGIELMAPGGVFVWFGIAAIITGLISFGVTFSLPVQFAVFGAFSILGLVVWIVLRRRATSDSDNPFLNNRAARYVGTEGFLSEPIVGERGRMELGDSVWRVTGPDLPAGHRVRVVGFEGTLLRVESAESDRTGVA